MHNHETKIYDSKPYRIYLFEPKKQESIPGYLVVSTAALNVESEAYDNTEDFSQLAQDFGNQSLN
ncbi:MAG: hypothetical protein HRU34_22775 [Richelia sp.]|nr:hypothetical protein [Richelia sp.]CDN16494.1 hypothetical protein RintRC_1718 [Richelia intracellularis]